jgi:hypothetical protein
MLTFSSFQTLIREYFTEELNAVKWERDYLMVENQSIIRAITPPPPPAPLFEVYIRCGDLWNLLDLSRIELSDAEHISTKREFLADRDRAQAEQLVQGSKFKIWMVIPTSARLLVHGNFGMHEVSALSLFCSTLTQTLRVKTRFLPIAFFCGSHIAEGDQGSGGRAMIKSLIAQLLSQQDFDTRLLHLSINTGLIQQGDIGELCTLFGWLVRGIPEDITLFCMIDGVVFYERDWFLDDMSEVLAYILQLVSDGTVTAAVKVLVTSPTKTHIVRQAFGDDLILSMAAMPRTGWGSSKLRLERQLNGRFDGTESENEWKYD